MIHCLDKLPDHVLAVSATGRVTAEDYERVLRPALEERLARHARIRLLYHLGPDFTRFTTTALWDDARLGMHHLRDFERVAVVTDVHWIRVLVGALKPVSGLELRLFGNDQLPAALDWVAG